MLKRRKPCDCADECVCTKKSALKTTMQLLGVGILIGTAIGVATKRIFDEIFVEDDWSDVEWGEDDDIDFVID